MRHNPCPSRLIAKAEIVISAQSLLPVDWLLPLGLCLSQPAYVKQRLERGTEVLPSAFIHGKP